MHANDQIWRVWIIERRCSAANESHFLPESECWGFVLILFTLCPHAAGHYGPGQKSTRKFLLKMQRLTESFIRDLMKEKIKEFKQAFRIRTDIQATHDLKFSIIIHIRHSS